MYREELLAKIRELSVPYLTEAGYVLVDLVIYKAKGELVLKFLVDRPAGGITVDECASINEQLGAILDREAVIDIGYTLEVSSPGVDRPLVTKEDFLRVTGRRVRVFLNAPFKKKIEIEGVVEAADGNYLFLWCRKAQNTFLTTENRRKVSPKAIFLKVNDIKEKVPFKKINKAKQVIE